MTTNSDLTTDSDSSADDSAAANETYDLDLFEARVLGVLIEKSFLTPDNFPLSMNALVNGTNQLTAREPVMALSEEAVALALASLQQRKMAIERQQAGGRVPKYEAHMNLRMSLDKPMQAVLCVLLLRGPQTAGEIRARTERMHPFQDGAAVEEVLTQLADKFPPMAVKLPRVPGTKESRYTHLLCGNSILAEIETAQTLAPSNSLINSRSSKLDALEAQVQQLQKELETLKLEFHTFIQKFD